MRTGLGKYFAAALAYSFLAVPATWADTIVSVTGPNDLTTETTVLSNNLLVGFSTSSDYNNVSIDVSLLSFFGGGDWNLVAYLTDQIGAGTTAATNQIAGRSSLISIPGSGNSIPYTITPFNVFSGLSLTAGNYYLTLSGTFQTANVWAVGSPNGNLTTVTAAGASVTKHDAQAGAPDLTYLPASSFGDSTTSGLWFSVTGDPVTTQSSAVPEPGTLGLLFVGGGLALIALGWRTRRIGA